MSIDIIFNAARAATSALYPEALMPEPMPRERWEQMRSLIEAGWHSGARCGWCGEKTEHPCYAMATALDCEPWKRAAAVAKAHAADIDTKQAQHDGSRQIYGGLGTPQREDT